MFECIKGGLLFEPKGFESTGTFYTLCKECGKEVLQERNKKKMKAIELIGTTISFAAFLVLFVTFMGVYYGIWGGIDINRYGEAELEWLLLIVAFPIVVYSNIAHVKRVSIEAKEVKNDKTRTNVGYAD